MPVLQYLPFFTKSSNYATLFGLDQPKGVEGSYEKSGKHFVSELALSSSEAYQQKFAGGQSESPVHCSYEVLRVLQRYSQGQVVCFSQKFLGPQSELEKHGSPLSSPLQTPSEQFIFKHCQLCAQSLPLFKFYLNEDTSLQ